MSRRRTRTKKRRRSGRAASQRPERQQDPRLIATIARAMGGEALPPDTWVVAMAPVRLDDGRVLMVAAPQASAFSLIEGKRHRDAGVRQRTTILGNLRVRPDGTFMPANPSRLLDCLSDLVSAVLYSFTAIESLCNHAIDHLPDQTTVTIERERGEIEVSKEEMARRLRLDEKLTLVMPLHEGGANIKGTAAWERYLELKELRDELLHVKERGYSSDPDDPAIYGRLVRGDGDQCVEQARTVIEASWAGFLPAHVLERLDR